jgi:hypothetical protein
MIARMAGSNPKSNIRSASSKTWKPSCKTNVRYSSVKNVCRWYCTGISNCKTKAFSSVWVGSKWVQELRMDTNQIRHLIQRANTFLHQVLKPSWCCNNNCLSIWVTRPTISVKHQIPFSKSQSWPWMNVQLSLPLAQRGNFFLLTALQFRFKNEIPLFGIMIQYLPHQLSVQTFEVPLKSHHIYRQSSPHIHSLPPPTHLQSANTNLRFSSWNQLPTESDILTKREHRMSNLLLELEDTRD